MSATTGNEAANGRLRILHLVLVLGPTNSQYNEHCLPQMHERALSICTYFTPLLTPPPHITVFPGDGSVRGFFRALRRSLAADDYDAIHAHAAQSGLMLCMALVARPSRFRLWRRTVYTVHDSWYDFRPRNKLLMLPALALFRRVVFCSQSAYDSAPRAIRMLVGRRARVVQNAADLARVDRVIADTPPSRHDGSFTIVSVGRLDPVKDPIAMVDAFVAAVADDSRLVMIGAGSLEKNVAERIAGTGRAGQIELTGLVPREEVFARYARAPTCSSRRRTARGSRWRSWRQWPPASRLCFPTSPRTAS